MSPVTAPNLRTQYNLKKKSKRLIYEFVDRILYHSYYLKQAF